MYVCAYTITMYSMQGKKKWKVMEGYRREVCDIRKFPITIIAHHIYNHCTTDVLEVQYNMVHN